jgi:hypothetical protein
MPANSLFNKVMGNEMEIGNAVNGANGLVEGAALGVLVVAGALVVADDAFGVLVVAGAALGGVVVVGVATLLVVTGALVLGVDDAAPAGASPAKRPAARTTPLPIAPSCIRLIRLKMLLLLYWEKIVGT